MDDQWNVVRAPLQPPLFFSSTKDKFLLKFPFDEHLVARAKKAGMKWSPSRKIWYANTTKMFFRNFMTVFPEARAEISKESLPSSVDYSNYKIPANMMEHQGKAVLKAINYDRYGYFHDTGCGKTYTGIEIFKQKKVRSLVVCPLSIIEVAWMEDLQKFAPDVKAVNLWSLYKKERTKIGRVKLEKALREGELFLVNFETFKTKVDDLKRIGFKMLLVDESSKMKDARSQITKMLHAFGDDMDYCYLFSGTPAPNNELEYWSQIRMIDPLLFGQSFYSFRNNFFNSFGFGGFKWGMKPEKRDEFLRLLGSVSEVVEKNDVLDLPERTINVRKVYLSKKELDAYKEMENDLIIELEDMEVVAENAAVKMMKLREGSSGFFIAEDGNIFETGQSKLNELMSLLEEIGRHQVIIWTQFQYEAQKICEKLKKLGHSVSRVDGTVKDQETKNQNVRDFISGKSKYIVAHPKSLGHGVTLVNCHYNIYFSMSHSYEMQYQSGDRIYRKGQVHKCADYFLVADRTIDSKILYALNNKKKVVQEVFEYLKKGRREEDE